MISIILVLENRSPARTVAWLLVLILLPGIGIFIYFYIGRNHRKKKTFIKKQKNDYRLLRRLLHEQTSFSDYTNLFRETFKDLRGKLIPLLIENTNSPITINNEAKILNNGDETFEEMLRAIEEAEDHINMEFFIIKDSSIANRIKKALVRQAQRGIKVRLIYDAVGCWRLKSGFFDDLKEAGGKVGVFLPVTIPLFGSRLNYRNHRKILVIDGRVGFLGGINIGDEYLGLNPKMGFWRDTHLKLKGEAVYVLQAIFLMDWFFVSGEELDDRNYFPKQSHCGESLIQIAASGPDSYWQSIHQAYFTSMSAAKNYVYIASPYLVPDESILMALKTAALSGIDVRILIPAKPDHKTVFWASRSHFTELLEAGVKIYQYQKGFIHSKIIIADDVFASVGTANLDIRSFQLNFEVNAFIYDEEVNLQLKKDYMKDLEDSTEITLEEFEKRSTTDKLVESLARLFSPIL